MVEIRKFILIGTSIFLIAGCTSSGGNQVNSTLAAPQAATTQAEQSNSSSTTALAENSQPSAAENVTNTQLTEQTAALNSGNTMTFLPVQGAPQDKVTLLSRSLKASAAEHQLNLLQSTQPGAEYQVKGYFSALSDGSGTLLVFIWDVLDTSGKRLHRINGQERAEGIKSDPWQAITDRELSRVADTTASRLKSWIDSQPKKS